MTPGFAEAISRTASSIAKSGRLDGTRDPSAPDKPFPSEGPDGHRERMRDRLIDRGPDGLADYELLEMLLFFAQPKGDTKRIAKRLMNCFGSYANTINASTRDLLEVEGVGPYTVAALKLVSGAATRLARAELRDQPILGNWDLLMQYLNAVMAREPVEQFRILFLDTKNRLIEDRLENRGTINHTPVYPGEVARAALKLHAAGLILVHNHPSGDPTPSLPDIEMTTQIQRVLQLIGVALHDHIIVGNGAWTSLRKEGFL